MDTYKKLFEFIILAIFLISLTISCSNGMHTSKSVQTGADLLLKENFELIKNKNLGIVTNHTAILSNGVHIVDTLFATKKVKIVSLFGPEHGIRGDAPDGHSINDGIDLKTGIPVYSLYGKSRKPSKKMLDSVDILLFDIQDVGARFYTFISTMYYAIQAAAENEIPIIILDRPNPINGLKVDGPMLDPDFKSFVGIAELPIQHGMTVGELAKFFNRIEVLETERTAQLTVIKMQNWKREFYYEDCNIPWVKPSPNMPTVETAVVYPGLCLIEGTNISEGRGTYSPFLIVGSPYINSKDVINEISKVNQSGFILSDTTYTPVGIPNMSTFPKYKDEFCNGLFINITDRKLFEPIKFTINLIYTLNKLYPQEFKFREGSIDRLWGSDNFRTNILNDNSADFIIDSYKSKLTAFKKLRNQYLLY